MKIISFPDFIRRFHSGEEFVVFDTETTGLNTFHDDIVEVAGKIWKKDGSTKSFNELIAVNSHKLAGKAQEIHGIKAADIKKARQPNEVLKDFVDFCAGRALVAHNIKFDFDILNSNLVRNSLTPYPNDDVACTLIYAREQMLPNKLDDLARHYKVETQSDKRHRALYDVEILIDLLNKIMKEHEPEDLQYSLIF